MNKNKIRYDKKTPRIVKNEIVLEEITFQGKKIVREKIVKVWNIPDIITEDIGYQLMFGTRPSTILKNTKNGPDAVIIDRKLILNQ